MSGLSTLKGSFFFIIILFLLYFPTSDPLFSFLSSATSTLAATQVYDDPDQWELENEYAMELLRDEGPRMIFDSNFLFSFLGDF